MAEFREKRIKFCKNVPSLPIGMECKITDNFYLKESDEFGYVVIVTNGTSKTIEAVVLK